MPGMDGYETARLIRDLASPVRNHHIPIIAVTAHAMAGDRDKCLDAGMDDYVSKPIQVATLRAAIERWANAGSEDMSATAAALLPELESEFASARLQMEAFCNDSQAPLLQ